ncbi:MAG TPA: FAD-binding oxidoreductase [Vicinamibacterales bacterium]|nr:FAD-binding oxidoreductase [Vicinamibacterales bacterium]
MAVTAEFVIVGGGIYGAATAWALAGSGASVLVLEAGDLAAGASGGLGKRGVRANGRDLRELPLMRRAYDLWPSLAADLGAETGFERTGHLQLYERHHDIGAAGVRARVQAALGIPTGHLEGGQVRDVEGGLAEKVLGALHAPLDGVADHEATTRAYAAAAVRAGATLRTGAEVARLERAGDRIAAVELAGGERVEVGRALLLLNNGGLLELAARQLGCRLPVWNIYPQVVRSTPAAVAPFRSYIGHLHRPVALKMIAGGAVMLSGGWRGRWNPPTRRGETIPASVAGNWAEAVALFPAIADLAPAESLADRAESTCLDLVPIIDRVPGVANAFLACGWSGHGWAIAPAVAPLLADWVRGAATPELLRPFGLSRFPDIRG